MVELILVMFPMTMLFIFAALWNEHTNTLELPNYKGGVHWHFDFSARWASIRGDFSRWVTGRRSMVQVVKQSTHAHTKEDVDDAD